MIRTKQSLMRHCLLNAVFLIVLLPNISWSDNHPISATDATPETMGPALATSVPAAMQGLKEKSIYLIDVRLPRDFEQYNIPGSLNIALHAIKTKAYLKSKPVVLVNEGFAIRQLAETCINLKQAGYKATILAGGLLSWKAKGGSIVGDAFAMQQLNRISPRQLIREGDYTHYLMVDASVKNNKSALPFKNALRLDLLNNPKAAQQLKTIMKQRNADPFQSILVYTNDGRADNRIQRTLARAGIHTVFFLTGGRQAYQQQIEYMSLAAKPKNERTLNTEGCPTCPRQNQPALSE